MYYNNIIILIIIIILLNNIIINILSSTSMKSDLIARLTFLFVTLTATNFIKLIRLDKNMCIICNWSFIYVISAYFRLSMYVL